MPARVSSSGADAALPGKGTRLKITFFAGSVVGYVDNPAALHTRALAHGLALRGNDVRVVEERQNQFFTRTLRAVGAGASRHFHEQFRAIQHATYEPRSGAPLLEWVTREVALIDVAVVADDAPVELTRWLANVTRNGLTRALLAWQPELLTAARAAELELGRLDLVLAPEQPAADALAWLPIARPVASQDALPTIAGELRGTEPIVAAEEFERLVRRAVTA